MFREEYSGFSVEGLGLSAFRVAPHTAAFTSKL